MEKSRYVLEFSAEEKSQGDNTAMARWWAIPRMIFVVDPALKKNNGVNVLDLRIFVKFDLYPPLVFPCIAKMKDHGVTNTYSFFLSFNLECRFVRCKVNDGEYKDEVFFLFFYVIS